MVFLGAFFRITDIGGIPRGTFRSFRKRTFRLTYGTCVCVDNFRGTIFSIWRTRETCVEFRIGDGANWGKNRYGDARVTEKNYGIYSETVPEPVAVFTGNDRNRDADEYNLIIGNSRSWIIDTARQFIIQTFRCNFFVDLYATKFD